MSKDWTTLDRLHVTCQGLKDNKEILARLNQLGFSLEDGSRPDPNQVQFTTSKTDSEDRVVPVTYYRLRPVEKRIEFNHNMYARNHFSSRIVHMTFEEFMEASKIDDEVKVSMTKHVMCVGRKQNIDFLSRLQSNGFVYSGGQPVDSKRFYYTATHIDEDGASNQVTVYAVDESLRMVAFHNSMSLLKLHQDSDVILTSEEYLKNLKGQAKSAEIYWKRKWELGD